MPKQFLLMASVGILLSFAILSPFDSMRLVYAINQTADVRGTQFGGPDDAAATTETSERVDSSIDDRFQGLSRSGHHILNSQQNVIQVAVCVIVESPGASC